MYLVSGIICCVLPCPSYHPPNFHCRFWRGWLIKLYPDESSPKNICCPSGLEHVEVVVPIVVPWNLPQSTFIFWLQDEAIPFQERLNNLIQEPHSLHFQTCSNTMLPINDEEFPICNVILVHWLLLCVGHYTKYLLHRRVQHMTKVVQLATFPTLENGHEFLHLLVHSETWTHTYIISINSYAFLLLSMLSTRVAHLGRVELN